MIVPQTISLISFSSKVEAMVKFSHGYVKKVKVMVQRLKSWYQQKGVATTTKNTSVLVQNLLPK